DITDLLSEALEVAAPPDRVQIERRFPEAAALVAADRAQLRQVLLNLIANAYEAMPDGGVLSLGVDVDVAPTGFVGVTVGDTGQGMDDYTLDRVFRPFFTSKPEGTGLGLAIVRRIVDSHGGSIVLESVVGAGTLCTLRLPAADAPLVGRDQDEGAAATA